MSAAAMDLSYTPEQEAPRRRARAWLARNLPRGARQGRSIEYGEPERGLGMPWG